MKIDDVYKALKNREVEAALVDSFVAANRPDLFSSSDIVARKIIMYPFTYGLVLSGAMNNVGTNLRNYVSDNRYIITQMVQKTTPKFKVSFLSNHHFIYSRRFKILQQRSSDILTHFYRI